MGKVKSAWQAEQEMLNDDYVNEEVWQMRSEQGGNLNKDVVRDE